MEKDVRVKKVEWPVNSGNYVPLVIRSESSDFPKIKEKFKHTDNIRLLHAAMGMCTEAGEFQDMLKRFFFYHKELDVINLIEELGDMLWYVGLACDVLEVTLEEVMTRNINKLRERYPEKFDEVKAIFRDLDTERKTLEEYVEEE